ncbi:CRE-TAG-120 protein [Caenorhabditis remanei]|uniref:CRE-TAG-120 protein n=1 Tax=Caenorhabditis remanei TaxID=31234 RepID=E3MHD6_CAERE|nr:CRE-TAG-120 protein [Caenorhabditis remanei]
MEQGYGATTNDDPDGKYNLHFTNQSVRAAFVRKVFMLVTIMFGITAGLCVIPMASEPFRNWVYNNFWVYFIAIVVFLVVSIALSCCANLRRQFPINIILLTIFTISAAVMTMFITACYNVQSVLICLCITTVCSGSVIIFAMKSKSDLTSKIGIAFMLSMVLFSFGMFALIFTLIFKWYFLYSVYSGLAALLMMFYLAIDVQLLMGGRKYELSPEDYIFAAMEIFLDILNIFLMLLNIFGRGR